jgi:alcohol dehydrogenase YqhD (iron-dependent ADH family)
MENFIFYNPTKLHFGKEVIEKLPESLSKYGKKVLLVYGKGSIVRSGLYDKVKDLLQSAGMETVEYGGIRPNPAIEDVDAAAELGRKHHVDMILAVGGGSVIDSAKIISITIPVHHSGWDFYSRKAKPREAVPLISVLTLAATGTEMNPFAVLSNHKLGRKDGYGHQLCYPKESFLDPSLTISVSREYTAYGIADLVAHSFEIYFGTGDATLSDRMITSIVREAMEYGPQLLNHLTDYDLRARIMYAATLALNGLTANGKGSGDWAVHGMGHVLSLLYDTPHGASLTIAYPAWLKFFKEPMKDRIAALGTELFRETLDADQTISRIEGLFKQIECPIRLSEINVGQDQKEKLVAGFVSNEVNGGNMKMTEEDYPKLIDLMLEVG